MIETATFVLVLGGGNALGSYQAGVYQALAERGVLPAWVIGASAGAINGAVIAGNRPEERLDRLRALWMPSTGSDPTSWWGEWPETMRRTAEVQYTIAAGRAQIFAPRPLAGNWWGVSHLCEPPSLFDTAPLARTLERLVDFDRLNGGDTRYTATAVNLVTGQDVAFDTDAAQISAEHVRASAALLPAFPPVEIAGETYVDPGLSANLPLDIVLGDAPAGPVFCLAVDLLPLAAALPSRLTGMAERLQDLTFAAQSRRTIAKWQAIDALRRKLPGDPPLQLTLAHLAYGDQAREVAGKAFDFSPESARHRWAAGHRDASAVLDRWQSGELGGAVPGLTVHHFAFGEPGPG